MSDAFSLAWGIAKQSFLNPSEEDIMDAQRTARMDFDDGGANMGEMEMDNAMAAWKSLKEAEERLFDIGMEAEAEQVAAMLETMSREYRYAPFGEEYGLEPDSYTMADRLEIPEQPFDPEDERGAANPWSSNRPPPTKIPKMADWGTEYRRGSKEYPPPR